MGGSITAGDSGSAQDNKFKLTIDHVYFIETTQIGVTNHSSFSSLCSGLHTPTF